MRIVFLLLFFGMISSNVAHATSCGSPDYNVIKEYPIIFKGKAVATTELPLKDAVSPSLADKLLGNEEEVKTLFGAYTVTKFDVQDVYKGEIGKEIDVYHFGKTYKDGLAYVIFTGKDLNRNDGIEGRIETDLCSPRIFLEENDNGPLGRAYLSFDRQLKAYASVKDYLEGLLREDPDNPYLYFQQAEFFEANSNYPAAAAAWRKGLTAHAKQCTICLLDQKVGTDTDFDNAGKDYVDRYIEALKKQGKNEEAQRILDRRENVFLDRRHALEKSYKTKIEN